MKRFLFIFLILLSQNLFTQTITTSGFSFLPDTINITVGDTATFILGSNHNAVEVDSLTWVNNGNTYNSGFAIWYGQTGTFIPTIAKTYYYVCQPHVSLGMKGVIIANPPPTSGCTDSTAFNFDPNATIDDGSCVINYELNTVIYGDDCNKKIGEYMAISGDGNYAISTGYNDNRAFLYQKIGSSWQQIFTAICPDDANGNQQDWSSCDIDYDGNKFVLGARSADNPNGEATGLVQTFTRSSSGTYLNTTVYGPNSGSAFGFHVSITSSGFYFAATASNAINPSTSLVDGRISVHNVVNGNMFSFPSTGGNSVIYGNRNTTLGKLGRKTWQSGGISIDGDYSNNTLWVATTAIENVNGINNVKVFNVAPTMPEVASFTVHNSQYAYHIGVTLNNNRWLAIHDAGNSTYGGNNGLVRVYKLNGSTYSQVGQDLYSSVPTNNGGYGNSIGLSENTIHNYSYEPNNPLYLDRVKLVVGGYNITNSNGVNAGVLNVWTLDSLQQFIRYGDDFTEGDSISDQFGMACDISDNGNQIIGGARFGNGTTFCSPGGNDGTGYIKFFEMNQFGCTNPVAINYNPNATVDDGSCFVCNMSFSFSIANPSDSLTCDGFAIVNVTNPYTIQSYDWQDFSGNTISTNNLAGGLCNDVYFLTVTDIGGCSLSDTVIVGNIYGCTNPTAPNYNLFANVDDGSCALFGCTDSSAFNFNPSANIDDGSCLYCDLSNTFFVQDNTPTLCDGFIYANSTSSYSPITYLWSNGSTSNNITGLCMGVYTIIISDSVGCSIYDTVYVGLTPGCTNPGALNFNPLANVDDGSCCFVSGCTDPIALNYDSLACLDDGSCVYCTYGCMDPLALNYDPNATCDDGSCSYSSNCTSPKPNGLYSFDVIDTRAKIGWNNMNDPNCMVWKYYVRYREVGTNQWTTKSAGVGNGLCNFGLNTITKQLLNLTPSTTYEFKMKAFYCGGTSSGYSQPSQFTTADVCPDMTNLTATTFNGNQAKVRFDWDTTGAYTFARILLRVDVPGSNWQTAGGFGVFYPTLFVNKFGLTPGQSYRAQGRTFCDPSITAYRSPTWTAPIFWTQPGSIKESGGISINNLDIYPNPSRDVFYLTFTSDKHQDLRIRILSVVGAEVYSEDREKFIGEYIKQISLDKCGKGIYFLEIETNTGIVNKKLILQ